MTVLNIFALEDTDEENLVSSLSEGEHIIGRGVTLNCNDKRISRKHALINVCKDMVSIKAVHVNPCFFKAADGNSITILPKDTSVELSDGDQFALLADLFWFKVRVIMDDHAMDKDEDDDNCNESESLKDTSSNNISAINGCKINLNMSTNSHCVQSTMKRCQEDNFAETCKRQKTSVENENKPNASTSFDKNVPYENTSSRPSSPINSLDLLLDTSQNLNQNIASNQLISNLNDILQEDYGTGTAISKEEQKRVFSKGNQKEAICDDNDQNMDNLVINSNVTDKKREEDENIKIKKENVLDSESEDDKINNSEKQSNNGEIINPSKLPLYAIKKENVEGTSESKEDKDVHSANNDSKKDQNEASCSKDDPKDKRNGKKSRRERCWYAHTCYRKNPQHLANFSHPGDDDFLSDPDDDRPECPFGGACYRTNLIHRRDYKHVSRPAPKPNDGGGTSKKKSPKKKPTADDDSGDDQNDDGTRKKRKAAKKKTYADNDSADDDYDYNDPFIDDASSDEFKLSSDEDDEDSTDWDDSQKVDEESQETRRLLKEAKRFTKGKQKKKD